MFDCRSPKPELLQLLLSTVKCFTLPNEQHSLENGFATSNGNAHEKAELPNGKLANGHSPNGLQNGHAPERQQSQVIIPLPMGTLYQGNAISALTSEGAT